MSLWGPPAHADNFLPTANSGPKWNDNSYIGFYYSSIIASRYKSATEWSRVNTWETTDMSTGVETSYDEFTDLYVSNGDTGAAGATYRCKKLKAGYTNVCEQADIVFNSTQVYSTMVNYGLACQEIGHSVGLDHGPNSQYYGCMYNPIQTQYLGQHNTDSVNINYPWN